MELQTKAVLIKNSQIQNFNVKVNSTNYMIVRKKLESVRRDIIERLKLYKTDGLIKSIYIPKTKDRKMQTRLNEFIKAKQIIDNSVSKIKEFFYK